MNILVCEENQALGPAASAWCDGAIKRNAATSIYVPAGNTPISLYKIWEREKPDYLRSLSLVQVDDILRGPREGYFAQFLCENLPSYRDQIDFIDAANHQADLAILGLGLNGHIAFHEPGLPISFYSGCVSLSETTCKNLQLVPGSWGISYGAAAFLRCREILLMVSGEPKREILQRLLDGDPTLPASALRLHPGLTILADRFAHPKEVARSASDSSSLIGSAGSRKNAIA